MYQELKRLVGKKKIDLTEELEEFIDSECDEVSMFSGELSNIVLYKYNDVFILVNDTSPINKEYSFYENKDTVLIEYEMLIEDFINNFIGNKKLKDIFLNENEDITLIDWLNEVVLKINEYLNGESVSYDLRCMNVE